jgi:hypothetical protein
MFSILSLCLFCYFYHLALGAQVLVLSGLQRRPQFSVFTLLTICNLEYMHPFKGQSQILPHRGRRIGTHVGYH